MKAFIDRILTYSRSAAFLGWLVTVWAALEAKGKLLVWPPDTETVVIIVGVTIAWLGRSGLAAAKQRPPESES